MSSPSEYRFERPAVVAALVGLSMLLAIGAVADDASVARKLRAQMLVEQGRCDDVVALARRAPMKDAADATVGLIAGRCLIESQRFDEALAVLTPLRDVAPDLPDLELSIAIAQYQLGDLAAAEQSLVAAEGRTRSEAQLELYRALVALARNDLRAAAEGLERAAARDPDSVEPVASYYAMIAWEELRERERAEVALARVLEADPDGAWSQEAGRALAAAKRDRPRFWGRLEAGVEYDSNVVLRGVGVILPPDISDEAAVTGVWSVEGGAELFRTKNWAAGALVGYTGNAHDDLSDYDTHLPNGSLWLDRALGGDTLARLRWDVAYSWVGGLPFLYANRVGLSVAHDWGQPGVTEFFNRYLFNDFLFPEPLPGVVDLDRDGWGTSLGFEHRYLFGGSGIELRGGYRFHYYHSKSDEYRFNAHELRAGLRAPLPFEVRFDGWASYTHAPYENRSVFASPSELSTRTDDIFYLWTEFERTVYRNVAVAARYRFTHNGSNVDVYDYDRHVVGLYLNVRLP